MSRPCSVCSRADRAAIDVELIARKESVRALASRVGVGHDALDRHRKAHLRDVGPAICPACGSATEWVVVNGGRRVCECDDSVALAEAIVAALNVHLVTRPETTAATVSLACSIATDAASEALPVDQPSGGTR